jgi:hypothetical protein
LKKSISVHFPYLLIHYSREVQRVKTARNPPQLAKNPLGPKVKARTENLHPPKRQVPLLSVEQKTRRAASPIRQRVEPLPDREAMHQIIQTSNRKMGRRKRRRQRQQGVVKWEKPMKVNLQQTNRRQRRLDREKTLSL